MKNFNPDIHGYTNSLLQDWVTCRQLARFKLNGWRSDFKKDALFTGALMHELLAMYYTGEEIPNIKAVIDRVLKGEKYIPTSQQNETAKFISNVLYNRYVWYWGESDRKKRWQAIESEFDVWFCGYRLRGKRDGLFVNENGELWLLETKTASQISEETLLDRLTIDFQNLFYIVATEKEIKRRVYGVLYNVIRVPQYKQTKKDGSVRNFHKRISNMIAQNPTHFFHRYEIVYPAEVRAEFEMELLDILNEIHAWVYNGLPTYKNRSACVGRYTCRYLKACASGSMAGYEQTREIHPELEGAE